MFEIRLFFLLPGFEHSLDFSSAGLDLLSNRKFDQNGFLGALGLAAAIEITPKISFGATLNIWTDELLWENEWEVNFRERGVGTTGGVATTIDTEIEEKFSQFRGINANFGLLWNISKLFTLGVVVKTPFEASLEHEFTFQQVQTLGPPVNTTIRSQQIVKEDVDLDIRIKRRGYRLIYSLASDLPAGFPTH